MKFTIKLTWRNAARASWVGDWVEFDRLVADLAGLTGLDKDHISNAIIDLSEY